MHKAVALDREVAQLGRVLGFGTKVSQVRILSSRYYGGVAQLARASGSYPGGRGFDPLRRYIVDLVGPLAQLVRALGS